MQVDELFSHINSIYRGSDDDAPTEGSDDYALWINTTNRRQREAAVDPKQPRASNWVVESLGTLAAGTNTFDLDDTFFMPDSYVLVTPVDQTAPIEFIIIKPQEIRNFLRQRATYISGFDPSTLTFVDEINSDDQLVGADVTIQGYTIPDDVTNDTDTVQVDDPYWLATIVASDLAFSDLQYADKAPDLLNRANDMYRKMNHVNRRGVYGQPRVAKTSVNRITGTSSYDSWRSR